MALAKWQADRLAAIDSVSPTTNYAGTWNIGKVFAGGSKTLLRRTLFYTDLNASPDIGIPIHPLATINSAYFDMSVTRIGDPSSQHHIYRVRRGDWVQAEATWNIYKTSNNWTTAGAGDTTNDIDNATPTPVTFNGPTADGSFTITGLEGFRTDALNNRSGILNVRLSIDDEANDGVNKEWGATAIYFVVDYTPPPMRTSAVLIG